MAGKSPGPEALRRSAERRLIENTADSTMHSYAGTPCREWQLSCDHKGYGCMGYGGRVRRAHRVAYELAYGPIPVGAVIDHLCRNHRCVSPPHLEAVTPRVNTIRGETLAAANLRKTHCPRGHAYTPENTYTEGRKRRCRACARLLDPIQRPRKTDRRITNLLRIQGHGLIKGKQEPAVCRCGESSGTEPLSYDKRLAWHREHKMEVQREMPDAA